MGCCAARTPRTWSQAPLSGYQQGSYPGWRPVIGDVESSAGGVGGACCDACADHAAEETPALGGGCSSGTCGLPYAGMKLPAQLPARQYARVAGLPAMRPAGASMIQQTDAWAEAAGLRSAGAVHPLPISTASQLSTPADLRELSDADLYERYTNLSDAASVANPTQVVLLELDAVEAELSRRETDPGSSSDEEDFSANRRQVAETTARQLEPGDDQASRARRDRIIAQSVSGTLATFNNWLERQYGVRVAEINANRDITLRRLLNEDREADREYRRRVAESRGSSDGSGSGGAAPLVGLGLVGLLLSVMR